MQHVWYLLTVSGERQKVFKIDFLDQIEDKNGWNPPNTKGNEEYTQWLQNVLLKAVAKVTDPNLSSSLYTVRKYLEVRMCNIMINYISDLYVSFHLLVVSRLLDQVRKDIKFFRLR